MSIFRQVTSGAQNLANSGVMVEEPGLDGRGREGLCTLKGRRFLP